MARCQTCGAFLILAGARDGSFKYCNRSCHQRHLTRQIKLIEYHIPEDSVETLVNAHFDQCPLCQGEGPVDVYTLSHPLIERPFREDIQERLLCCQDCGRKRLTWTTLKLVLMGWWTPMGLIATPFLILANVRQWVKSAPITPSPELRSYIRNQLAVQIRQQASAR
ncbi:hypothetical protein [Planctomicrobium sp. SH664]|uniref:hypothetical protein n=1 Tax=Planctomicrobium sp. SH664 TaxID=3448125 RepID=UPI003F5B2432